MAHQINIGKKIAFFRKNANLTQEQLGIKLNVSGKTVSKWERGITLPDILMLKNICTVLNVSIDNIFNEENVFIRKEKLQKKTKLNNLKNTILYILIIIFVFNIVVLIHNNYFHVFNVISENENILVNGYVIFNNKRNMLIINSIKNLDKTNGKYDKIKVIKVEIIIENNNKKIFTYDDLNVKDVSFNDNLNDIAIYVDNFKYNYLLNGKIERLILKIQYVDKNYKKKTIDIILLTKK